METGLVSIEVISKIHSVSIDMEAVKRRYFVEDELTSAEVLRILQDHGIRSRLKKLKTITELLKYPMPLIIISPENAFHILVGKKEDKYFIFDCKEKKPCQIKEDELSNFWDGRAIAVYPRFTKTELFLNMKWLFKEFFKHRQTFSAVITASFFIQLFGLGIQPIWPVRKEILSIRKCPSPELIPCWLKENSIPTGGNHRKLQMRREHARHVRNGRSEYR